MSVGVSHSRTAARRATINTPRRAEQMKISRISHAMNGAVGIRIAIAADTTSVLATPAAKTGNVPNRPPISATRILRGTWGPASASQRVRRQRGRLYTRVLSCMERLPLALSHKRTAVNARLDKKPGFYAFLIKHEFCGELPSRRSDQAFELAVFAARRAAAGRLDALELAAGVCEVALGGVERAGIAEGRDVIGIGGERPGIPGARFVETAEPGIGKADGAGNVGMIVVAERLHRGDAGFVFARKDERARRAEARLLLRGRRRRLRGGRRRRLRGGRRWRGGRRRRLRLHRRGRR